MSKTWMVEIDPDSGRSVSRKELIFLRLFGCESRGWATLIVEEDLECGVFPSYPALVLVPRASPRSGGGTNRQLAADVLVSRLVKPRASFGSNCGEAIILDAARFHREAGAASNRLDC